MRLLDLGRDTWKRFDEHGDLLAAAISFYTLLSIAPLVAIAVTVAGLVFDPTHARAVLLHNLEKMTSADVAAMFLRLVEAAARSTSKLAGVLALLMLLWSASRLFLLLQEALNVIWGVRVTQAGSPRSVLLRFAAKRLISFVMVLGCAALLLGTLAAQSFVAVLVRLSARIELLADVSQPFLVVAHLVIPLALLTPMLALVYRVLPDVRIRWRDVWAGAGLTATLLLLGTWPLALLLGRLSPAWLQGAVGAIAGFMLWTYYLAQVFLLGAAFTCVWSRSRGSSIEPEAHAKRRSLPTAGS
jgi:membrane protein